MGVVAIAALAVVAFVAFVWLTQRQLLYFPGGAAPPAAALLPGASDVVLETEDGLRLGGLFLRGAGRGGATIVVFNGNAGDRGHRAGLARSLAAGGHGVLLFDYRGYGGNPGRPTEAGLAADARAALRHLESRDDVDRERIVYFGESLGAAVAARLAVERAPLALVLRSPFTSIADVGRIHYPYLPVTDALLFDHYRTIDHVRASRVPLLVVAGDEDRIVPPVLSRRVFDAASAPKRYVNVPGADHNDPELADGAPLVTAVITFLEGLTR